MFLFFSGESLVPKPANETQARTTGAGTAAATVKGRRQERRRQLQRRFERRRPVVDPLQGLQGLRRAGHPDEAQDGDAPHPG